MKIWAICRVMIGSNDMLTKEIHVNLGGICDKHKGCNNP